MKTTDDIPKQEMDHMAHQLALAEGARSAGAEHYERVRTILASFLRYQERLQASQHQGRG